MTPAAWIARAVEVLEDVRALLVDPSFGDKHATEDAIDALLREEEAMRQEAEA